MSQSRRAKNKTRFVPRIVYRKAFVGVVPICVAACSTSGTQDAGPDFVGGDVAAMGFVGGEVACTGFGCYGVGVGAFDSSWEGVAVQAFDGAPDSAPVEATADASGSGPMDASIDSADSGGRDP
jgi:hypothetical protein